MPKDESDSRKVPDELGPSESGIGSTRADRDAFRAARANWPQVDLTNRPDISKWDMPPAPDPKYAPEGRSSEIITSDAEKSGGEENVDDQRDAEQLHAFGNKERPRPARLKKDLKVDSPEVVIGPYAPTSPKDEVVGASVFIDPEHAPCSGKYHRLPPGYEMPDGLGLHADGADVGGLHPWGHRTIYPTHPMTAGEFIQRVADLDWEFVGNKK